jgi:hypothetical protein
VHGALQHLFRFEAAGAPGHDGDLPFVDYSVNNRLLQSCISDIYVSTAPKLEGPWSKALSIGKTCPPGGSCGTLRYCIAPHPEFDPSGKTVLVTWTDANIVHAVKVTWE